MSPRRSKAGRDADRSVGIISDE